MRNVGPSCYVIDKISQIDWFRGRRHRSSSSAEHPNCLSGDELLTEHPQSGDDLLSEDLLTEDPSGFSGRVSGTGAEASGSAGASKSSGGKRKSDVDWKSIEDPGERRKQRRLAKNRATAAVSRWVFFPLDCLHLDCNVP